MTFLVTPNSNIIVFGWWGLYLFDSGYIKVAGCLVHGNEYLTAIKYCEILEYIRKY
jgi:parallel beta-helix repeat protein